MSVDGRLERLYGDARRHQLNVEVRATCSRSGVVDEPMILAKQAEAAKAHEAVWLENPAMTVAEDVELRAARGRRGLTPNEAAAQADQIMHDLRTPVYGTRAVVRAVVAAEKAANSKTPVLNRMLNAGAGNSPALARLRLGARADQLAAHRPAGKKLTP